MRDAALKSTEKNRHVPIGDAHGVVFPEEADRHGHLKRVGVAVREVKFRAVLGRELSLSAANAVELEQPGFAAWNCEIVGFDHRHSPLGISANRLLFCFELC